MHKCLKCGRLVSSVDEISEGCSCGSKVFVFHRLPSAGEEMAPVADTSTSIPTGLGDGIQSIDSGGGPALAARDKSSSPLPSPAVPESKDAEPPAPEAKEAEPAAADTPAPGQKTLSDSFDPAGPITSTFPLPDAASSVVSVSSPDASSSSASSPSPAAAVASSFMFSSDEEETGPDEAYSEVWMTKGGRIEALPAKAPPITSTVDATSASGPASPLSEVANVRQLKRGVYEIDVGRLGGEPLVVQDSAGIYYVRLPFTPLGEKSPGESVGTPRPKNKID